MTRLSDSADRATLTLIPRLILSSGATSYTSTPFFLIVYKQRRRKTESHYEGSETLKLKLCRDDKARRESNSLFLLKFTSVR